MRRARAWGVCWLALGLGGAAPLGAAPVQTVEELQAAVAQAKEGTVVELAAGTFTLPGPLELKSGVTLRGAGMDRTILTPTADWKPATASLPDPEVKRQGLDERAYLLRLSDQATGITIADLTLRGPRLHGGVFAWQNAELTLTRVRFQEFRWCGLRTFGLKRSQVQHCEFIDAGGRWAQGMPGVKGGVSGGAIFATWTQDCDISHNRFRRTRTERQYEFYGIKGRQARRCRIHHNTIEVNFSIEFPFENDEDVEIDHNVLHGTVSIPKFGGGPVPASGHTFHIHHNYFRDSYAIEFPRNGVEIDHNLFDFDPAKDHGNLISGFGKAPAKGPASFHNNLVSNPGRGVIWINEAFNHLEVRNNHVIARTTATPRKEGLLGLNGESDFSTIVVRDNIIECVGQARPLFRTDASRRCRVENNSLTNVSDAEQYANPSAERPRGLTEPLKFTCGVQGELSVDGWKTSPTPRP